MFEVRHSHPGLFGVALIEVWTHAGFGVFDIAYGDPTGGAATPAATMHVYEPLMGYIPGGLVGYGVLHLLVAVVMAVGMSERRWWETVVRAGLVGSISMYSVQTLSMLLGIFGANLSHLGILTFWNLLLAVVGLLSLACYAVKEDPLNPVMAAQHKARD